MSSEGVKASLPDNVDISIVVAILPPATAAAARVGVRGVRADQGRLLVGRGTFGLLLMPNSSCSPPWIDPGHPFAPPEVAGRLRLGICRHFLEPAQPGENESSTNDGQYGEHH